MRARLLLPEPVLERLEGNKRFVVSDTETNGLLQEAKDSSGKVLPPLDRLHCATVEDIISGEHFEWTPDTIHLYHEWMMDEVGVFAGHNIIPFDVRATKKVYPKYDPSRHLLLDTLSMCKMVWPADLLIGPDMKRFHQGRMPAKYLKRQSLGAWGYRLGNYKGEYDGGWESWSPEMQEYMVQDGVVNVDLLWLLLRRIGWTDDAPQGTYRWPWMPFWIESEMAAIITEQEAAGVHFDQEAALTLTTDLKNRQAAMASELRSIFGSWYAPKDDPIKGRANNKARAMVRRDLPPLRTNGVLAGQIHATVKGLKKAPDLTGDYVREYYPEGSRHVRIEWTEFNPSSRTHLADRLQRKFGWKPNSFTPTGKPQVDEDAIKGLPSSIVDDHTRSVLLEYFVVTKTLGFLVEGKAAWMSAVSPDGAVHGRCDPLGTVTGRAAHYGPNLGQTPSVDVEEIKDSSGKIISKKPKLGWEGGFGYECRGLFTARPGWELTGTDMASLEFIMLGHYLYPMDEGAFSRRACDPKADLHAEHGQMTDLSRRDAKTLGYLIIYGGGDWKAGLAMGVEEHEIGELLHDTRLPGKLRWKKKLMGADYEEPSDLDKARIVKGSRGINAIMEAITGLKYLKEDVTGLAKQQGWVRCIDGRKLYVRKPHAALNTLLQGGGASACKVWIILFHKKVREAGYRLWVDYNQVLWVHDEKQNEHRPGIGETIARLSDEAAKEAGEVLGLRGTFRTESKHGKNWAETH